MADPEARRATVSASNEGQAPSRARARRGAAVSLAALAIIAAACGGTTATTAPSVAAPSVAGPSVVTPSVAAGGGSVTLGSNASDAVPKAALAAMAASCTASTGVQITINTTDHGKFQDSISSYLQGTPDDIFTWFAGYRMRFFAAQGLSTDVSDVWSKIGGDFSAAFKAASTGDDGKQYFVPNYNYPWVVIYRKALWAAKGYQVPKTLDDLTALATKMKADGITPIAFADKDGWPAMGTFDILNMRINGYDFHVRLMAGKESWDSSKVKAVFNQWRELLPYTSQGALGLTWQEGAQQMINKEAGMYLLGSFVGQQATAAADHADLDFFAYPSINPTHGQDSLDAPIDGFLMSKKAKNSAGAKQLLTYLGSAAAENTYLKSDANDVGANKHASSAHYNALQKKAATLIGGAKHIAQYMDRDTRPDFASTVMIPALQQFLNKPTDVNGLVKGIQKQKKAIFGS